MLLLDNSYLNILQFIVIVTCYVEVRPISTSATSVIKTSSVYDSEMNAYPSKIKISNSGIFSNSVQ